MTSKNEKTYTQILSESHATEKLEKDSFLSKWDSKIELIQYSKSKITPFKYSNDFLLTFDISQKFSENNLYNKGKALPFSYLDTTAKDYKLFKYPSYLSWEMINQKYNR